jgi:hypothetical protein
MHRHTLKFNKILLRHTAGSSGGTTIIGIRETDIRICNWMGRIKETGTGKVYSFQYTKIPKVRRIK